MSAYFITSTGTGVGKTFTTCALIHAARAAGVPVQAYKPVISGWDTSASTDTAQIIAAGGGRDAGSVSPWRFWAPLSPHRAAAQESQVIEVDALADWSRGQLGKLGLTLIEGVGGVMVPINDQQTVLDWMVALKLPVILVVGSYLGTISHTLTALAVMRAAGLTVAAIIINETEGSAVDLAETQAGLAPFIGDIPLHVVQPLVSSPKAAADIHSLVGKLV